MQDLPVLQMQAARPDLIGFWYQVEDAGKQPAQFHTKLLNKAFVVEVRCIGENYSSALINDLQGNKRRLQ